MSDQLDFALNLVNEFSGPADEGAKSALALASAIAKSEKATEAFQRALNKEDRVGALAARISKANAELSIAKLSAPAGAALPFLDTDAAAKAQAALKKETEAAADAAAKSAQRWDAFAAGVLKGAAAAGAAVAALAAAGGALALHEADQKRNLQLTLEAMLGSAEAGVAMEEQFQALSNTVPTTRNAIDDMGKSLIRAGLRGDSLIHTLGSLSTVESAAGAEGAQKLSNMIEKWNIVGHFEEPPAKALIGTGVTLDLLYNELAAKTGKGTAEIKALMKAGKITTEQGIDALNKVISVKLGDVATKKMIGIGVQWTKFKENIGNLFEDSFGDKLEPLLNKIAEFASLFSDTSESGKTLKLILGEIFSTGGGALMSALGAMKEIFEGIEIAILEMLIDSKPLRDVWQELFGTAEMNWTGIGEAIGKTIGYVAEFVALVLMGAELVGEGFGAIIFAISDTWENIKAWWDRLDFSALGAAIVDGMVEGIKSGASRLWDAVTGLGTGSKDTMATSIDAHSPSRDFEKYGYSMPMGLVGGIDSGAAAVNDSVSSMVRVPELASGGGGGRGPTTVNLSFEIGAGARESDAKAIADEVIIRVTQAFESAELMSGEGAPAQAAA